MNSWCSCREGEAQNPWRHWTVTGPGQAQQEATVAGGSASRLAQTAAASVFENGKQQNTDNDSVRENSPSTVITSQKPRAQTHMNYKMNIKYFTLMKDLDKTAFSSEHTFSS